MRRLLALIAVLLPLPACTEAVVFPQENTGQVAAAAQCTRADAILARDDPFANALETWTLAPKGDKSALAALDAACEAGRKPDPLGTELAACTLLGLIHSSGEGVKRDAFTASQYFLYTSGCENFGFGGDELHQARDQSVFFGMAACCGSMGVPRGCEAQAALARYKVAHRITPLLERACASGRGTACFMLANFANGETIFHVGHVEPTHVIDGAERDALLNRACDRGVGAACSYADRPDASCNAGWGHGCLDRGKQAFEAHGDMTEALPWYEKACALGQSRVCTEVGDMLSLGEHEVPVDHERAVRNYANAWR